MDFCPRFQTWKIGGTENFLFKYKQWKQINLYAHIWEMWYDIHCDNEVLCTQFPSKFLFLYVVNHFAVLGVFWRRRQIHFQKVENYKKKARRTWDWYFLQMHYKLFILFQKVLCDLLNWRSHKIPIHPHSEKLTLFPWLHSWFFLVSRYFLKTTQCIFHYVKKI